MQKFHRLLWAACCLANILSCSGDSGDDGLPDVIANDGKDPTPPPPPPGTLAPWPGSIVQAAHAGTIEGSGGVGADGQYTYTIPIQVPAGRMGMQPDLSLQYTSRGGNGLLGRGWRLSGLSEITVCRVGDYGGSPDGYCLDGEPLIQIPDGTYRTRDESYSQIYYADDAEGGRHWRVNRKDGRILHYDLVHPGDIDHSVDQLMSIQWVWVVVREEDRDGNTITYKYEDDSVYSGDAYYGTGRQVFEYYPTEIDYTSRGSTAAQRSITFVYNNGDDIDNRLDTPDSCLQAESNANHGIADSGLPYCTVQMQTQKRLWAIHASAPQDGSIKDVTWYKLDYAQSATTGETLLQSVQRCGVDGGCTLKKKFGWSSTDTELVMPDSYSAPKPTSAPLVIDVDGNGTDELIFMAADSDLPHMMSSDPGALPWVSHDRPLLGLIGMRLDETQVVDLDGDGHAELLGPNTDMGHFVVARWNPMLLDFYQTQVTDADYTEDANNAMFAADLDGDGLPDLVNSSPDTRRWYTHHNHGNFGFDAPVFAYGPHTPLRSNDINVATTFEDTRRFTSIYTEFDNGPNQLVGVDGDGLTHMYQEVGQSIYEGGIDLIEFGDVDGDGTTEKVIFDITDRSLVVKRSVAQASHYDTRTMTVDIDINDPAAINWALQTIDVDGDGRQEILLEHRNGPINNDQPDRVYVIDYDEAGNLVQRSLVANDGSKLEHPPDAIGDFNGDGRIDFAVFRGGTVTTWGGHVQRQDQMTDVSDEGAAQDSEQILYTTAWHSSDAPVVGTCVYPQHCVHDAITVAYRRYIGQGAAVGRQELDYSYLDPRFDVRRGRFLGFSQVTEWAPDRATETVTTYDLGRVDQGMFALAGKPKSVRTVTGITTAGQPASATARVVQVDYIYQFFDQYPNVTVAELTSWVSNEWEQPVSFAWEQYKTSHTSGVDSVSSAPISRSRYGSYVYDAYGNPTQETINTTNGVMTNTIAQYHIDAAHWLVGELVDKQMTSGTAVMAATYGLPTRHIAYTYGSDGFLATVTLEPTTSDLSLRQITTYTRNPDGTIARIDLDAPGRQTRTSYIAYDTEGIYRTQTWNDLSHSRWTIYDTALGVLLATMDSNGIQEHFEYDDLGRVVKEAPGGGMSVATQYSERTDASGNYAGMLVDEISDDGSSHHTELDELGREISAEWPGFDGTPTYVASTYDLLGRKVSETRPAKGAVGSAAVVETYDNLDRKLSETNPEKSETYNQQFFRTTMTDTATHQSQVVRDVDDNVVTSTEYLGAAPATTTFTYGPFGNVANVQDPSGNVTWMSYDLRGRRTHVISPDTGVTNDTFDGFSDQLTHTTNSDTTTYLYDLIGRRIRAIGPDGVSGWAWDISPHAIGQLAASIGPDGIQLQHIFDEFGRPTRDIWTVDGVLMGTQTSYDSLGRPASLTYPRSTTHPALTVGRTYNAYGYMASVYDATTSLPYYTVTDRNAANQLAGATYGNSVTETRSYTGLLPHTINSNGVLTLSYSYDSSGQLIKRSDKVNKRDEIYGHDALHRLTSWSLARPGATTRQYNYGYKLTGDLQTIEFGATTLTTNTFGNPSRPHEVTSDTSGAYSYDLAGRQTGAPGRTVTFDELDHPRTVTTASGVTTFAYDAEGTRIKKTTATSETIYIEGVYEKRTIAGAVKDVYYVDGEDGPVAQVVYDEPSATQTVEYLHRDAQGTVNAITDAGGTVTSREFWEPFGAPVTIAGVATTAVTGDVTLGMTGDTRDAESGLVDMHGRVYDPRQHRFLTADPHVTHPGSAQSWNPYSYVMNRPMDLVDPTGFDDSCGDQIGCTTPIQVNAPSGPPSNAAPVPTATASGTSGQKTVVPKVTTHYGSSTVGLPQSSAGGQGASALSQSQCYDGSKLVSKQRLIDIAVAEGVVNPSAPAWWNQILVGRAFERFSLYSLHQTSNKVPFWSPELNRNVIPDGIGDFQVTEFHWIHDTSGFYNEFYAIPIYYPRSATYEAKATGQTLGLGYQNGQIQGIIDSATQTPAGRLAGVIPPVIFMMPGDGGLSLDVRLYATARGVSLWISRLCEYPTTGDNADLRMGPPILQNPEVFGRSKQLPSLIYSPSSRGTL